MRTPRNRSGACASSGRCHFPGSCRSAIQVNSAKPVVSPCAVVELAKLQLGPQALAEIMPVQLYRGPRLRSNTFSSGTTFSAPEAAPATRSKSFSNRTCRRCDSPCPTHLLSARNTTGNTCSRSAPGHTQIPGSHPCLASRPAARARTGFAQWAGRTSEPSPLLPARPPRLPPHPGSRLSASSRR